MATQSCLTVTRSFPSRVWVQFIEETLLIKKVMRVIIGPKLMLTNMNAFGFGVLKCRKVYLHKYGAVDNLSFIWSLYLFKISSLDLFKISKGKQLTKINVQPSSEQI